MLIAPDEIRGLKRRVYKKYPLPLRVYFIAESLTGRGRGRVWLKSAPPLNPLPGEILFSPIRGYRGEGNYIGCFHLTPDFIRGYYHCIPGGMMHNIIDRALWSGMNRRPPTTSLFPASPSSCQAIAAKSSTTGLLLIYYSRLP